MSTIWTLTKSALLMFVRNRQSLFFTLFMPMVIMLIFGLIGFDRVPKIPVGVVSQSPAPATEQFIENLRQVPGFEVHTGSDEQEANALAEGERAVVFAVPGNLAGSTASNPAPPQPQNIIAVTSAGQQQQAQTAISIVNQILDRAAMSLAGTPRLFNLVTKEVNTRNQKYIDFLLPGVVALAIMQMAVFSVAFVFADYKEKGILKRLLATPMRPFQFITANVITRLVVALVQAAILIAVGVLIFKAQVIGSYLLVFLIALLGAVMFLGLGFTISGLANTVEAVPAIANLVVFPMLFLGGTFFPVSTMPDWLQKAVKYLPLTYFSHSLREVMTKDASIGALRSDLLWMLAWSAAFILLAGYVFRFEGKRV